MLNLSYTSYKTPQEWFHIHKCFTDESANRILDYFPDPVDMPITGKRDGANDFRLFVSKQKTPELAEFFAEFDTAETRKMFTDMTGVDCVTGHLRIELCQDGAGFYLDTHVDIPEKLITLQIYLDEGDRAWGTTLFTEDDVYRTVPFEHNSGWMSHKNTPLLHGVRENVVDGIRKSVIINYVVGNWRDKEQLYDYASSSRDDIS